MCVFVNLNHSKIISYCNISACFVPNSLCQPVIKSTSSISFILMTKCNIFTFFVFVSGAQEVFAKIVAPPPLITPKIEPASSDATSSSTSEQRRFLAADVYKTKDGKIFVNVSRKTMSIVGRKSEDLLKIMEGTTVEGLIESGELVRTYKKTRLNFYFFLDLCLIISTFQIIGSRQFINRSLFFLLRFCHVILVKNEWK